MNTEQGSVPVVLKRPKPEVEGSDEMAEMERQLNERVTKRAQLACAQYLGSCKVEKEHATSALREGLWLIWKLEGVETLGHFLRYPHFPRELTEPLLGPDAFRGQTQIVRTQSAAVHLIVAQTTLRQLLDALAVLHSAGMVHRDVKPQNLLLDEESRTFKLIDLGACADMRTGTNFNPDETILDPKYAAPEEYVLPLDSAPDLASHAAPVALALGATSWVKHSPDRFDMYAVGIILMQLSLPCLRSDTQLQRFNREFRRFKYDLMRWKRSRRFTKAETRLLDADGGAGWDLAQLLLSETPKKRPSAAATRSHRWFRAMLSQELSNPLTSSMDAVSSSTSVSDVASMAMREALSRLRRLESAVLRVEATRTKQTTTLARLKQSQANPTEVQKQEQILASIDAGLQKRLRLFEAVSQDVLRMLGQSDKQIRRAEVASDTQVKRTLDNVVIKRATMQGKAPARPTTLPGWGTRVRRMAWSGMKRSEQVVVEVSQAAGDIASKGAKRVTETLERLSYDNGNEEEDEEPDKFVESLGNLWKRVPKPSSEALRQIRDGIEKLQGGGTAEDDMEKVLSMRSKMNSLETEVDTMNEKMQQMEQRLKEQRRLIEIMEKEDMDDETLSRVLAEARQGTASRKTVKD